MFDTFKIYTHKEISQKKVNESLLSLNYKRVDDVCEEGDYSFKGDTLEIFPVNFNFPIRLEWEFEAIRKIYSFDKTLSVGKNRVDIARIGGVVRRIAEIKLASEIDADIIVMDGNLKAQKTYELEYLGKLYGAALDQGKVICAISKTAEIFTDAGGSLLAELDSYEVEGKWYYYPIVECPEDHRAEVYALKLHDKSDYVFKLEVLKESNNSFMDVLPRIITGSNRMDSPINRPNSSGEISPKPLNRVISGLPPNFSTAIFFSS